MSGSSPLEKTTVASYNVAMSGKIDVSKLNSLPEDHKFAVAKFFSEQGKDVEFIKPSNIPNIHTPDIHMDGVDWEIKSPQGQSK